MNKMLCLAVDLRRVAYWLYRGDLKLAKSTLDLLPVKYSDLPSKIACYDDIWVELKRISDLSDGVNKAAERACTASVILQNAATLDKTLPANTD